MSSTGGGKTGIFSPGGAAVGGQRSSQGQPSVMRPSNTMNASAIGSMDLAASLASTLHAKGGEVKGSTARGASAPHVKDSFDFVQGEFAKK